jgi:hypothetical protein
MLAYDPRDNVACRSDRTIVFAESANDLREFDAFYRHSARPKVSACIEAPFNVTKVTRATLYLLLVNA